MMISSKAEQIKNRLLEFCCLMTFRYHGLDCDIDPFDSSHFHVNFGGNEQDLDSIEKVMESPIFDGNCLNDIAGEIEIVDW